VRFSAEPVGETEPRPVDRMNRPDTAIRTRKRTISPRTPNQARYVEALQQHELVFGLGPAGTGKTYLAVAQGVQLFTAGVVDRLILSRPAVEAGERLGFLPGDLKEKVDPYLRPLYDALYDMLPGDHVVRHMETGAIEVAPLAFMRGRTLANAFVILDEAQNTTSMQMRMFLTRLGENSRMAVTGDISQVDLPRGERSGLRDAVDILEGVEGVGLVRFGDRDVVRHPLVTRIVRAYDALDTREAARKAERQAARQAERSGAPRPDDDA
jgi:phosphate starvation-inducible PhoH-like protein